MQQGDPGGIGRGGAGVEAQLQVTHHVDVCLEQRRLPGERAWRVLRPGAPVEPSAQTLHRTPGSIEWWGSVDNGIGGERFSRYGTVDFFACEANGVMVAEETVLGLFHNELYNNVGVRGAEPVVVASKAGVLFAAFWPHVGVWI